MKIEYSKLIMDEGQAVFVTNEFHVLRSELMAKINGIDATHIGASTPITLLPVSCVREFIAQDSGCSLLFLALSRSSASSLNKYNRSNSDDKDRIFPKVHKNAYNRFSF